MRELMIKHENWKRSEYLPRDWLYKIHWEGQMRDGKYSENLVYFSREGVTCESNKTAVEYMRDSPDYDEQDEIRCKEFAKRRNQETQDVRFKWNDGDHTVPKGWKMRKTGEREYILSPENIQYMSRVVALIDLIRKNSNLEEIEAMREKLVHEGWQTNSYLPRGWFWKMWEGETRKQKLERNLFFVTREGVRIESFKAAIEFMETNDAYDSEDIGKLNQYKKAESVDLRRKTYDWEDGGSTLPRGWMKRKGKGLQQDQERILSPSGEQYRSRFNALLSLVKNGATKSEINEMKSLLIHEGFATSSLLPPGWMFKKLWEGADANGRISSNMYFISDVGELYESVKSSIEYLDSLGGKEQLIENFKLFQSNLCKNSREQREDWIEDETVPPGWKRRFHKASGKEFILGPDGRQYKSRAKALLQLYEDNASTEEINQLHQKLCHEGWEESDYLPDGWLYKLNESKANGKTNRSWKFFSSEGLLFESVKSSLEYMKTNSSYPEQVEDDLRKLLDIRNKGGDISTKWTYDANICPAGWRTKVQQNGERLFKMANGKEFASLLSAFVYMSESKSNHEKLNEVRGFLKHEGWEYDRFLPSGWQIKYLSRDSSLFLDRHGKYFDSIKKAVDFIHDSPDYTAKDLENLSKKLNPGAVNENKKSQAARKPSSKRSSESDLQNQNKKFRNSRGL